MIRAGLTVEWSYGIHGAPQLLRQLKEAGKGLSPRKAGERILQAALDLFRAEITVLDQLGESELFRVGSGSPSHNIHGVHIHPVSVQWGTWQLRAHKDAVSFLTDDVNMSIGTFLQALELGFRVGFKK
jgi:hypothetical protein